MQKNSGLGKGLSSLIPNKIKQELLSSNSPALIGEGNILKVPVEKVKANPHQPRGNFDHDSLEDLTNSIKEHGILQPLIVTLAGNEYQLISGERRLRAAKILGLEKVPVIIREVAEQQKLELALVENLQRQDLNSIEEAIAFQRLIDEFGLTQEQVGQKVGKGRVVVANTLRLLTLPTEIQKAVINGKINYSAARVISGLPVEKRMPFFKKVLSNDMTVRAIEGEAKKIAVKGHFRQTHKDPELVSQEDRLQSVLGTKVSIKKSGSTGQIIIEFYSQQDLINLIEKLARDFNTREI